MSILSRVRFKKIKKAAYRCHYCRKAFTRRGALHQHLRAKHPIPEPTVFSDSGV